MIILFWAIMSKWWMMLERIIIFSIPQYLLLMIWLIKFRSSIIWPKIFILCITIRWIKMMFVRSFISTMVLFLVIEMMLITMKWLLVRMSNSRMRMKMRMILIMMKIIVIIIKVLWRPLISLGNMTKIINIWLLSSHNRFALRRCIFKNTFNWRLLCLWFGWLYRCHFV